MSQSYFFLDKEVEYSHQNLVNGLKHYAMSYKTQVYVVQKPLGENKYSYDYSGGLTVLVPSHKIMILDLAGEKGFDDYCVTAAC